MGDGAVESLWSIDQYFEFVLVLMLSTGLSFQVPVIQLLLGQTGIVSSAQMFSVWRYVVVGAPHRTLPRRRLARAPRGNEFRPANLRLWIQFHQRCVARK